MIIQENINLKDYSYMKTGGIGKRLYLPENTKEILELREKNEKLIVLGNGSNVLFGDGFIEKDFLLLSNFNQINEIENGIVYIGAGVKTSDLVKFLRKNNFGGYEELAGIPGTIGGMLVMNAGAHGREIFDLVESVEIINREGVLEKIEKKDIKIGYRWSELKGNGCVIIGAFLRFYKGFNSEKVEKMLISRKEKQPIEFPNLGSIFKNPEGNFAAKLIEESGLKGVVCGGAKISEKHANFIINFNCATSENVLELIGKIKKEVITKYQVYLEEEIIIIK